ncbi:MAG: HAD family hydrolase [Chitinophagaceae bacterium]|jgi:histidinol-phosphate phosphatase family protein|nr:HAD family hydrolase [Chitinophagaceae bacterium]
MIPQRNWTLFLDRDGVINEEKEADYIHHWSEFRFYAGAAEAVAQLSRWFKHTIIVTNQKGVGKGVTPLANLQQIHRNMQAAVEQLGGKIDAIYFCPATDNADPCRKPNPGMAHQAFADFADIVPEQSLMVGNNLSDMLFGRNAGMHTVFLQTTQPQLSPGAQHADWVCTHLPDLVNRLRPLMQP